jgi:hypothetical protein
MAKVVSYREGVNKPGGSRAGLGGPTGTVW